MNLSELARNTPGIINNSFDSGYQACVAILESIQSNGSHVLFTPIFEFIIISAGIMILLHNLLPKGLKLLDRLGIEYNQKYADITHATLKDCSFFFILVMFLLLVFAKLGWIEALVTINVSGFDII